MESLGVTKMLFQNFIKGKKIFITGHTGFKGSWLCHVLNHFDSKIYGFSLPPQKKSHFTVSQTEQLLTHNIGDITDYHQLDAAMRSAAPDIVIHMAAQPLVRYSYDNPIETFRTNVMGTTNVLASALNLQKKPLVACITSDKCYENLERDEPYNETDRLGGHDPYSASKGASELVIASFAKSFYKKTNQPIVSLRGGNVIGGGDWSPDRIMTDIVSALVNSQRPVIRSPLAIRPWQHILDVLAGYLSTIEYTSRTETPWFEQFNIGPNKHNQATVDALARMACHIWGGGIVPKTETSEPTMHEAKLLKLDISKALSSLDWYPRLNLQSTVSRTLEWYKAESRQDDMETFTRKQINDYFTIEKSKL